MNQAPTYVEASYRLFDKELPMLWCFGSHDKTVKEMDHSLLKEVMVLPTKRIKGNAYYLKGALSLAFRKDVEAYIIIGEPALLTTWILPRLVKLFHPSRKVFFWSHGWYGRESRLKAFIKKIYFKAADGVLTYGNYARKLMIKEGFRPETLHTIHNSLNHDVQVELRNGLTPSTIYKDHFGNFYPVLVMIGRITLRKQLELLLEAVAKMKSVGQNFNVVLIGNGEGKSTLEKLANTLNIEDRVWFYGACYDERTNAELLYNADMSVVPGDIGLTGIHSLTFGLPTLTHNRFIYQGPEFEAIIPGVTGDFFEYKNMDSMIDKILGWFATHPDREAVRRACYKEIDENWTPEFELNVLKKVLK